MLLILTGMDLATIGNLDILTFNALLTSVLRITYNQRTEAAWTAMIAAQGTQKSMKDWVKPWAKIGGGKESKGNLAGFLALVGKGY